MQRAVLFPLFFISLIAGQDTVNQQLFKTTEAHYRLGKYEIVIGQKKRIFEADKEKHDWGITPTWCSAFIEIKREGQKIERVEFNDIHPFGGHSGIHLPVKQESSRHFILMKYGNYDCRTIIITDEGKLFDLGGGSYRIFQNRYLISPRELPDAGKGGEFSVFDLLENEVRATVRWGDLANDISLHPTRDTGYIIRVFTNGPELFAGIVLVDVNNWRIIEQTGSFYRLDLETGKTIKAIFDEKKHSEFVIDYSNIDSSNECECKKTVDKLL